MANKVFNIIIKLSKEGGADKDTIRALTDIKSALTQGAAVAGAFVAAYYAIDKVLDATVGKFASYAKGVDVFASAVSTSAEEASRLIQVADDLGVSSDNMQAAMFRAVKTGIEPTIAGLAAAADHYNSLATAEDKAKYLADTFGKSSQELTRLLIDGGQSIRDRSAAVDDSLVLDAAAIEMAREYEEVLYEQNDKIMALKVSLGRELLPVLVAVSDWIWDESIPGWQEFGKTIKWLFNTVTASSWAWGESIKDVLGIYATPDAVKFIDRFFGVQGAARLATDGLFGLKTAAGEAERASAVLGIGLEDLAAKAEKLRKELIDRTGWEAQYTGAEDAAERAKLSLDMMGDLMQGLSDDGALVWNGFLAATGKISPAAAAEFARVYATFLRAKEMLEAGIAVPIVVDFLVNYKGGGKSGGSAFSQPVEPTVSDGGAGDWYRTEGWGATGHPDEKWLNPATGEYHALGGVFASDLARVGERGEEWLVRNGQGDVVVLPNDMIRRLQQWGITPGMGFVSGGILFDAGGGSATESGYMPHGKGATPAGRAANAATYPQYYRGDPTNIPVEGSAAPSYNETVAAVAAISQESTVAAVEAVAPVITQAVQTFQSSNQQNAQQVSRQTQEAARANASQLAELKRIANLLEDQASQLAAEIQKRRS